MTAAGRAARWLRIARVATLVAPSLVAWAAVRAGGHDLAAIARAAAGALVPLGCVMAAALTVRAVEAVGARRPALEAIDLLTAPGRALLWTAAAATVGAVAFGWASLAVLGLLALGVGYVMVTWTALMAAGEEPWRALSVTRSFAPATAVEGDLMRERIVLAGARVPLGFRLLVRGGLPRHGTSAHVVPAEASGGEVALEAELGPARRGEHEAAPVELWLQDVLGVCRSRVVVAGGARATVLPRPGAIDDVGAVVGARGDDAQSVPAARLPTDGWFRLRGYAAGDDARRIHWVRSLAARALIVRQPDELPPEEPAVRLVLDTELVGARGFATPAVDELCDALVRVWLSAGRALSARGVRVTMAAAVGDRVVAEVLTPSTAGRVARLGARATWQAAVPLGALCGDGARPIVVSARPRAVGREATWIVVPECVWTEAEPAAAREPVWTLPHPRGSADNRWLRRRRRRRLGERVRRDGVVFDRLMAWGDWQRLAGSWVARPRAGRVALEAIR